MTKHFDSIDAFLLNFTFNEAVMPKALHEIGDFLTNKAKDRIGAYQDGWAALAASTEEGKARMGYLTNAPLLRTGELRDSISSSLVQDQSHTVVIGSTDPVALFHEAGTVKMPPRPVFASLVREHEREVLEIAGRWTSHGLSGWSLLAAPVSPYVDRLTAK